MIGLELYDFIIIKILLTLLTQGKYPRRTGFGDKKNLGCAEVIPVGKHSLGGAYFMIIAKHWTGVSGPSERDKKALREQRWTQTRVGFRSCVGGGLLLLELGFNYGRLHCLIYIEEFNLV